MHWKPRFNCLMSSEIIAAARAEPRLGALPWDGARIQALKASCEKPGGPDALQDDLDILNYVLMALSRPGFNRLSTVSVFSLQFLLRSRPGWFRDVPALVLKRPANAHSQTYGLARAPDAVVLPRLHWHLGEARLLEKDYPGAVADFTTALRLDPALARARLSLAVAVTLRGDGKRGLELLKEAAARAAGDPDRGDILDAAAVAGEALGFGAEAAAGDPDYWVDKAEAEAASGRKEEGRASLVRALALSPQPQHLLRIAQCSRRIGDFAKVLELTGSLVKSYPDHPDVWLLRAESAFTTERKETGADALARAERLNPGPSERKLIAGWRAWLAAGAPSGRYP
jgi:tetratricopeptide (TPR) repeat protein